MLKNNPSVTVIIPSYKRPGLLLKTLKAVYKQKGGYNISVIVVDDYSPEPLRPIIKKDFPKTKIIETGKIGPAEKRDLALKYATGEILAFLSFFHDFPIFFFFCLFLLFVSTFFIYLLCLLFPKIHHDLMNGINNQIFKIKTNSKHLKNTSPFPHYETLPL